MVSDLWSALSFCHQIISKVKDKTAVWVFKITLKLTRTGVFNLLKNFILTYIIQNWFDAAFILCCMFFSNFNIG